MNLRIYDYTTQFAMSKYSNQRMPWFFGKVSCALFFCMLTACNAANIALGNKQATSVTLSTSPSRQKSRIILETFFDAYNRHDLPAVLATFDRINYGDCDYANGAFHSIHTSDDLAKWLQERFADHDHFVIIAMDIGTSDGYPPNDPRVTGVDVERTSNTLQIVGKTKRLGIKIILTKDGDKIGSAAIEGNISCTGA